MKDIRTLALAAAVVLLTAVVAGCGDDKPDKSDKIGGDRATTVPLAANAPDYCRQLATLPTGLGTAVSNAASGGASDADRAVIDQAVVQLRAAAADGAVPADLRDTVTQAAAGLDRLVKGQLDQVDAAGFGATFENLGKVVDRTCAAK